MDVTHPEHSLVYGTARTLLLEHPTHLILCLDVESNASDGSFGAIDTALRHINSVDDLKHVDAEFVERDGVFHISRIVPDDAINLAEQQAQYGAKPVDEIIHGHDSTIRLVTNQRGTLDALVYVQVAETEPLGAAEVEIEVRAAALNFKVRETHGHALLSLPFNRTKRIANTFSRTWPTPWGSS